MHGMPVYIDEVVYENKEGYEWEQGRPQGERPSHTRILFTSSLVVWEGHSYSLLILPTNDVLASLRQDERRLAGTLVPDDPIMTCIVSHPYAGDQTSNSTTPMYAGRGLVNTTRTCEVFTESNMTVFMALPVGVAGAFA